MPVPGKKNKEKKGQSSPGSFIFLDMKFIASHFLNSNYKDYEKSINEKIMRSPLFAIHNEHALEFSNSHKWHRIKAANSHNNNTK